ncbi:MULTISPECIES: hypothetical protein [unclassified Bartonella]|uniref:hypothetical protein n=1 Tax=unclassified Bartonella TaxID=2645622 RepID=UPI0035CFF21F
MAKWDNGWSGWCFPLRGVVGFEIWCWVVDRVLLVLVLLVLVRLAIVLVYAMAL